MSRKSTPAPCHCNTIRGDTFLESTGHRPGDINITKRRLAIEHTEEPVLIQLTLNQAGTVAQNEAFNERVAANPHDETGLRQEDVIINRMIR